MEKLLKDLRTYTQVSTQDQEPLEEIDAGEVFKKTLLNLDVAIKNSGGSLRLSARISRLFGSPERHSLSFSGEFEQGFLPPIKRPRRGNLWVTASISEAAR